MDDIGERVLGLRPCGVFPLSRDQKVGRCGKLF
jgi:hypothetical protein